MNKPGALPRCPVVKVIDAIMRSADPVNCDPFRGENSADDCFRHWASARSKNRKPPIDYEAWETLGRVETAPAEYDKVIAVMRAAEHFLRQAIIKARECGYLHVIIGQMERCSIFLTQEGIAHRQETRVFDFVELNDSASRLKWEKILNLSQHPSAQGSAEIILESIMKALDPTLCDPEEWRFPPVECYLHWAASGKSDGKPALTFSSWQRNRCSPQSAINFGPFCNVINSGNHFLTNCFREASKMGNRETIVTRLERYVIAFEGRDRKIEVKSAADFVSLKNGSEEIKKNKIILASRHTMARSNPETNHFVLIVSKEQIPELVPLVKQMNGKRQINDFNIGCVQLFVEAESDGGLVSTDSLPVELPGGGVMCYVDAEDVWEMSVETGTTELIPSKSVVFPDDSKALMDFVAEGEARLLRRLKIQLRWGLLADIAGRLIGSYKRMLIAANLDFGVVERDVVPIYPGFAHNQLNSTNDTPPLLKSLLFLDTYIFWPAFGTLSAAFLVPILWIAHADVGWVLVAFAGAFCLSSVGSRPCAASVSYGGTGLGGWAFAAFFAVSQCCVVGTGFVAPDSSRLVDSIVGGLIGSRAKALYILSPTLFGIAIALSSFAIVLSARAMRGPLPRKGPVGSFGPRWTVARVLWYLFVGTLPGALIGVELNLPRAFGDGVYAVASVSGLVAGSAFFGCVLIATNSMIRAFKTSIFHTLFVAGLVFGAGVCTNHPVQVLLGCSATGILHGSVFTLVFLLTRRISKSAALAVVAASLEGVLGFAGFALAHIH